MEIRKIHQVSLTDTNPSSLITQYQIILCHAFLFSFTLSLFIYIYTYTPAPYLSSSSTLVNTSSTIFLAAATLLVALSKAGSAADLLEDLAFSMATSASAMADLTFSTSSVGSSLSRSMASRAFSTSAILVLACLVNLELLDFLSSVVAAETSVLAASSLSAC